MKVTTISAALRFSKDIGHGAWKVIEIGAEASVDPREDWQSAQTTLYQQLGQQMTLLWNNSKSAQESTTVEAPTTKSGHYCQEHQTEYNRYEKDGRVWYSHKVGNIWCKEK